MAHSIQKINAHYRNTVESKNISFKNNQHIVMLRVYAYRMWTFTAQANVIIELDYSHDGCMKDFATLYHVEIGLLCRYSRCILIFIW
jgi:hypothetical protein